MKEGDFGGVIPDYAAVVFDEAHEIEDVAGQYFGISVSNHQVSDLRRDIRGPRPSEGRRRRRAGPHPEPGRGNRRRASSTCSATREGRTGFTQQDAFLEQHDGRLPGPVARPRPDRRPPATRQERPRRDDPAIQPRRSTCATNLRFWMEVRRPDLRLLDRAARPRLLPAGDAHRGRASCSNERLFERIDTVVLTSATLAVSGGFDYVRGPAGRAQSADAGRGGLLRLPRSRRCSTCRSTCPTRATPASPAAAAEEIARILELSRGRAFVLFTSYQQMQTVHDLSRSRSSTRRCSRARRRAARCSTSSAARRTAFCSPRRRSGRASTCRGTS